MTNRRQRREDDARFHRLHLTFLLTIGAFLFVLVLWLIFHIRVS